MTQSELNSHLYQSANILHGSIDSSAYKHNIFGMIFLKRLSDPFDENVEKINSELISEGIDSKKTEKVARTAIEKLSRPPDFFLLFSTIHYEKHGGFEEFLAGVWDVLPKGTPLA